MVDSTEGKERDERLTSALVGISSQTIGFHSWDTLPMGEIIAEHNYVSQEDDSLNLLSAV